MTTPWKSTLRRLLALAALAATLGASAADASPARADDLGHLSVVNQGAKRFRYARDGVAWDLIDRNGRWTREEAVAVRDVLDGLPMNYLRKARASGVDKLYRDGALPEVPLQSVFGVTARGGLAVPMWPYQFVAFGDRVFSEPERTMRTVVHELGHCIHWRFMTTSPSRALEFGGFSWVNVVNFAGDNGLKSWNGFVTNYARTNFREDFAEAAEFYWVAPGELRRTHAGKFAYMRDHVFEGVVSPESVRQPDLRAIERVKPEITRLSSASGDHGDVRHIYGERFMGPLDGGFNTVRFSQVRALQVPISRGHMYTQVPARCNPSPNWMITVETQDGRSNAVRFEVERAWWRFW